MFTNKKIRKSPKFDSWPTAFGLILIFALGAMIQSCSDINSSASEEIDIESYAMPTASVTGVNEDESVDIQDFTIAFDGNHYDSGANTSTFSYTVTRNSDASGFNYMAFEIPECAAGDDVVQTPDANSVTDDEIRWTSSIGKGSSRIHTVTYDGKKSTGMIDATIQGSGSGDIETKPIPGPCKGVYTISGFIYVDDNNNETKNSGEGGIGNVTVNISKDGTDLANEKTSSNGSYTFNVYTGGNETDFSIQVDPASSASNSSLFENFSPTTNPPELPVTIKDADVSRQNLGFKAQTAKIISDFETETIKLRTENPSFWADQFKFSDKGKSTTFPSDSLNKYLDDINTFLLGIEDLDPNAIFDFGSDRFATAEAILTIKKNSSEVEQLHAELLAAMLNVVSGNGAVDEEGNQLSDFNDLILKTGVAALEEELGTISGSLMMNSTTSETTTFTTTSSSTIDDSGVLLRSFNGGGGSIGD